VFFLIFVRPNLYFGHESQSREKKKCMMYQLEYISMIFVTTFKYNHFHPLLFYFNPWILANFSMSLAINISFEIWNFHTNSNCITIFHKYCPNSYFILILHCFSYLILILILLVLFEFDLFTMYRVTSLKASKYVSDTLLLFLYFVHQFESKVNFLLLFRKFGMILFIYLSSSAWFITKIM